MAALFISYSSQDRQQVDGLLAGLPLQPGQFWRDIRDLVGGQSWPTEIGNAIDRSDCLLLFWSQDAAKSRFVELEYNAALALKKTIVPVLLDATPLPPILRAIHAVQPHQLGAAVAAIRSVGGAAPQTARLPQVAQILGTVKAHGSDEEVARLAIEALKAAGLVSRSHASVAIVALVCVFAIVVVAALAFQNGGGATLPSRQAVAGLVVDHHGAPLTDASLLLVEPNVSANSDPSGRFELVTFGVAGSEQTLRATKAGYVSLSQTVALGNRSLRITLDNDLQQLPQRIVGTIVDAGGRPVAGVRVVLIEPGLSTQSSADGRFEFSLVAAKNAEFTLQAICDGYEVYRTTIFAGNERIGFTLGRPGE